MNSKYNQLITKLNATESKRRVSIFLQTTLTKSSNLLKILWQNTSAIILPTAAAGAALVFGFMCNAAIVSGFQNEYATENWKLTSTSNGFKDISGAPLYLIVVGADNMLNDYEITDYAIQAAGAGIVSFDWEYIIENYSSDQNSHYFPSNPYDFFGIVVNNKTAVLLDPFSSGTQHGGYLFKVKTGDLFGFRISNSNNNLGRAMVKISNFKAPTSDSRPLLSGKTSVSEPPNLLGLILLGLASFISYCKKLVSNDNNKS